MDARWTRVPALGLFGPPAASQVVAAAARAERLGFGSLWVAEDYFYPSAFPVAAAAAAVTRDLVIATGVVNPYTRHPALLAMEAATVSVLAPGRFVLGLGSSIRLWIERQMGIPFVSPLATLRESVEIVRQLLAGQVCTYAGQCFSLTDVVLNFRPGGEIPIVLGVKGPKMLELAGRVADGIILSILTSPGHVARARRQSSAARVGTDMERRRLPLAAFLLVCVGKDGWRARESMKPTLARYLGSLHGQPFLQDTEIAERDTEPFRDALVANTSAAHLVTDALLDQFTVSGNADDCRAALTRFAAAGLDIPAFLIPPGVDFDAQLDLIAEDLIPFWTELRPAQTRP